MVDVDILPWNLTLKIIASTFHSVAIACTVFRLMYRWHMVRFWWEDGWAAFALVVDIPCLVSVWIQPATAQGTAPPIAKIAKWIAQVSFTTVGWSCRMSILFSIVRIAYPSQQLRRIALIIGCTFVAMWTAMIIQKIRICERTCVLGTSIAISKLITNTIADAMLVALPIWFFRRTRISARQRIMLYPVFFATFSITVIAILHCCLLFTEKSSGIIVVGHVKTAVSLIVCNLLVIVTFIYRLRRRGNLDVTEEMMTFTNVDLNTAFTESTTTDKRTSGTVDGREEASSSVRSCSIGSGEASGFSFYSV